MPKDLAALVERYLEERLSARAAATVAWERYALQVLMAFLGPNGTITSERVGAFVLHVEALVTRRGRPLAVATRWHLLLVARAFLHFLALRGHALDDLSALIVVRRPRHLPRPLSETDVLVLLEAAARAPIVGRRNRALVELLYGTGLRRAELLRLRLDCASASCTWCWASARRTAWCPWASAPAWRSSTTCATNASQKEACSS